MWFTGKMANCITQGDICPFCINFYKQFVTRALFLLAWFMVHCGGHSISAELHHIWCVLLTFEAVILVLISSRYLHKLYFQQYHCFFVQLVKSERSLPDAGVTTSVCIGILPSVDLHPSLHTLMGHEVPVLLVPVGPVRSNQPSNQWVLLSKPH